MVDCISKSSLDVGDSIGCSDYGAVFTARWTVTLKTYNLTQTQVRNDAKIRDEIDALLSFCDRNIQRFYGVTFHEGSLALVAESAEGGTLHNAIIQGRLGWRTKFRIAEEVASGLEYLHDRNIVHRDLKSANVLLTDNMVVKLSDFGLPTIKALSAASAAAFSLPLKSMDNGSLRWKAPELLTTRPKYSPKSDIYALGMVMWEMAACCVVPFGDQPDDKIAQFIKDGRREELPSETPRDYRLWVRRCWDQNPNKRPSAGEIVILDDVEGTDNDESASTSSGSALSITETLRQLDLTAARDGRQPTTNRGNVCDKIPLRFDDSLSTQSLSTESHSSDQPSADFQALLRKAERGDIDAQVAVASRLKEGNGVVRDDTRAQIWYRRAAEQGNADAQYQLGELYHQGRGVDRYYPEAVLWYRKAADQGHASAQTALGWSYQYGLGVTADAVEADYWYFMAAMQGDKRAQRILSRSECSPSETLSKCRAAAEGGDAAGQCSLGIIYRDGHGVEKNNNKAAMWFRKSAEQGNTDAQFNLASMFLEGKGVIQSDIEAVTWFRKAAEKGHADAQYRLGQHYDTGRGVTQNSSEAFQWQHKAASQGHAAAQNSVGWKFDLGFGVAQSDLSALSWYRRSVVRGHISAHFNLGVMQELGFGMPRSSQDALTLYREADCRGNLNAHFHIQWITCSDGRTPESDWDAVALYRQGAEKGFAAAQYNLARIYEKGRGVLKSKRLAIEWYTSAAELGHEAARERLHFIVGQ